MTRKRYKNGILKDGVLRDVRSCCMVVPEGSAVYNRIRLDGKGGAGNAGLGSELRSSVDGKTN